MPDSPHIGKIIERQMRLWEMGRRLAEEGGDAAREALVHLRQGPWVTVSRQLGAGGSEIARGLAERLGWQVFDHEIIRLIAAETDSREQILRRLDERSWNQFRDYITQMLIGSPGRSGYVLEMTRVMWGLAREGNAILLGRGANWFLNPRYGLRLRVIASREYREARLVETRGVGAQDARRMIRESDAEKAAFIRQAFDREIDDPLGYDMVLNLGTLDLETALEVTLQALDRKLGSQEP
jgi:cytidylate kinase